MHNTVHIDDEMDDKSLREASVLDFEKDRYHTPLVSAKVTKQVQVITRVASLV